MLDCRKLDFSPKLAAERFASAERVFGKTILRRVVAFALFILGVNRARISEVLDIPPGTVRSLIRRLLGIGVDGFIDRRRKVAYAVPSHQGEPQPALSVQLAPHGGTLNVTGGQLRLPADNPLQRKVVLLSLIGDGLLSAENVAPLLKLSPSHVGRLHRALMSGDVEAILDKRHGQLQDYRIGPDLKGQMIVQFVLELAEGGKASGAAVARRLGLHCDKPVSERTIRHHLKRMGLTQVKELLITGLRDIKRGSGR